MAGEFKALKELFPWKPNTELLTSLRTFTQTLDARFQSLEVLRDGLNSTINATREAALGRINAVLNPIIAATQAQVAKLQTDADAVQEQVDIILAGGFSANDVVESTTRVFAAPTDRAKIDAAAVKVDVQAQITKSQGLSYFLAQNF